MESFYAVVCDSAVVASFATQDEAQAWADQAEERDSRSGDYVGPSYVVCSVSSV